MKYHAFISYSHAADGQLARALQLGLQRLAKPWFRRPIIRIFRDQTSLSANPGLWSELERNLAECRHFILLASPPAAASPWIRREVAWWLAHRPIDTLFVVVTEGTLRWDSIATDFDWSSTTCLPTELERQFKEEPLYVDLTWAKGVNDLSLRHSQFRGAVLDLAAPLHNRPKDELDSEDIRQYRRQRTAMWSAVSVITVLAGVATFAAWRAVQNADEAVRNAITATSRQHAVEAQLSVRDGGLASAVTSALTAWRTEDTAEARAAVLATLEATWDIHALLRLHQAPVTAMVLRNEGKELLTWSRDGVLVAWDVVTRRPLRAPTRGMPLDVRSALFTADGRTLVTGLADGSIVLWDAETLQHRRTLVQPDLSEVTSLAFDPSGRLLAAGYLFDGRIVLWDVEQAAPASITLEPPDNLSFDFDVSGISFSADGRYLAAANQNPSASVAVWELPAGRLVAALNPSTSFWTNEKVAFLSGSELAIASSDGLVQIFRETNSGAERFQLISATVQHQGSIAAMAVGPWGSFATGGFDGAVSLWADANARPIVPVSWTKAPVSSLEYSDDGTYLAAGAKDGTVVVYYGQLTRPRHYDDIADRLQGPLRSPDGQWLLIDVPEATPAGRSYALARASTRQVVVGGLAAAPSFSSDGRWMTVTGHDRVTLWDLASTAIDQPVLSRPAYRAIFSPLCKFVILQPAAGGEIRLVDLTKTPVIEHVLPGSVYGVFRTFSPDESLALFNAGQQLHLVDTGRGEPVGHAITLEPLSDDDDDVYRFAFSGDGRWFVAGRADRTFTLHRAGPSTGEPPPIPSFSAPRFSSDGKWLFVQQPDKQEAMWNLTTLTKLFTSPQPTYWTNLFSQDSRWFFRKTVDGRAEAWNLQLSPPERRVLSSALVSDIEMSADGRWLVTAGELTDKGRHVDVWDLGSGGDPIRVLSAENVRDLEFTADGHWLLAFDTRDDTTSIWNLDSRERRRLPVSIAGPHVVSPDGHQLAIGDFNTLALVDLATAMVVTRFEGHSKRLSTVAFSTDGSTLASVDANGSLILWDVTSRRRLTETMLGPGEDEDSRYTVGFAPHGLALTDGIPTHPITWIEDICRRIDPGASSQEWARVVSGVAYPQTCDAVRGVTPADLPQRN